MPPLVSPSSLMLGHALQTHLDQIKPDIGKRVRRCQDLQTSTAVNMYGGLDAKASTMLLFVGA